MTGQWVQPTGPDQNQVGFTIDPDWIAVSAYQRASINSKTFQSYCKCWWCSFCNVKIQHKQPIQYLQKLDHHQFLPKQILEKSVRSHRWRPKWKMLTWINSGFGSILLGWFFRRIENSIYEVGNWASIFWYWLNSLGKWTVLPQSIYRIVHLVSLTRGLHRCWWQMDVGDFILVTIFGRRHQHLKVVTNTFRLHHPSPTSM